MKKALVLGVLAFFAINVATVQNANAQDKEVKTEKKATIKPEKKQAITKSAAASINQEKKDVKTEKKDVKTEKKDVKTEKKVQPQKPEVNNADADLTRKNTNSNNLNRSIPPKPKEKTSSNNNATSNPDR